MHEKFAARQKYNDETDFPNENEWMSALSEDEDDVMNCTLCLFYSIVSSFVYMDEFDVHKPLNPSVHSIWKPLYVWFSSEQLVNGSGLPENVTKLTFINNQIRWSVYMWLLLCKKCQFSKLSN